MHYLLIGKSIHGTSFGSDAEEIEFPVKQGKVPLDLYTRKIRPDGTRSEVSSQLAAVSIDPDTRDTNPATGAEAAGDSPQPGGNTEH